MVRGPVLPHFNAFSPVLSTCHWLCSPGQMVGPVLHLLGKWNAHCPQEAHLMCGLLARWMRTNACFCRRKDLQPVMLECSSLIELSFLRTEYSNEISSGYHTILQIASTLNLEIQKSKIPLVRSGSLKDRRKPSAASRRKSFRSSFNEDFDDSFVISEGEESWVLLLPDIVEAVHDISDMNSSLQISRELRQRWLIGCEWYWIRTYGFFFGGGGQTTLICASLVSNMTQDK